MQCLCPEQEELLNTKAEYHKQESYVQLPHRRLLQGIVIMSLIMIFDD